MAITKERKAELISQFRRAEHDPVRRADPVLGREHELAVLDRSVGTVAEIDLRMAHFVASNNSAARPQVQERVARHASKSRGYS